MVIVIRQKAVKYKFRDITDLIFRTMPAIRTDHIKLRLTKKKLLLPSSFERDSFANKLDYRRRIYDNTKMQSDIFRDNERFHLLALWRKTNKSWTTSQRKCSKLNYKCNSPVTGSKASDTQTGWHLHVRSAVCGPTKLNEYFSSRHRRRGSRTNKNR